MKFIHKKLAFIIKGTIALGIVTFFLRNLGWRYSRDDAVAKLYSLEEKRESLEMARDTVKRRVKNYFSFLCIEGPILSGYSPDISSTVEHNHGLRVKSVRDIKRVFFLLSVSLSLLFLLLWQFTGLRYQSSRNYEHVFVAILWMLAISSILEMVFFCRGCLEIIKSSKKELEKLDSKLQEESMQFVSVLNSIEVYDNLSGVLRAKIKHFEHFSRLVEQSILEGEFTEEKASGIEKDMAMLLNSRSSAARCA